MTLLKIRNKCKLTQKEASEITHTSLRTYCSYEKDEDTADQLKLQRIKQLLEEYADGNVNILKDKVCRHDKKTYIVNPWTLISNNQNYYLVGYEEGVGIKHFRVDRMTAVSLVDEPVVKDAFTNMKISDYAEKRFEMFDGDEKDVVLKFKDKMYAILDDRFGRKLDVEVIDDEYLKTSVRVCASDHFVCWILSLGDDIEISGPPDVRDGVKKLLEHRLELYK